ncbi:hypothetical protein IFM89_020119 [Coptis chinensis]|uniref:UV-B-induced protein At3g17800, chloroplastic n=1 Tax=Coptis chinensis TaxID=261450 RepID=A0A835IXH4_9MAGN|nr:hypothetical protein IFM89_020119 [Coptis chinensis]
MQQVVGVSVSDASLVLPYPAATITIGTFSFRSRYYYNNMSALPYSTSSKKSYRSFCVPKLGLEKNRRGLVVKASANSNDNITPIAPLRLESPSGQVLAQILQTHPHLLPSAIDQQIENLQIDRESQKEAPPPSQDLLRSTFAYAHIGFRDDVSVRVSGFANGLQSHLKEGIMKLSEVTKPYIDSAKGKQNINITIGANYNSASRRIAEVREKERQKALEEIVYCLIVQKFMDNEIALIPPVSLPSDPTGRVDSWPNQERKLESVHSAEAFEMIQSHLSLVLGERLVGPLDNLVHISKLKLGKLYAASIMYGYFLRRVDQRFQLERTMKTLPEGFDEDQMIFNDSTLQNQLWDAGSLIRVPPDVFGDGGGDISGSTEGKSYKLRSYVMYLDAETLQRYATIRSKEAISLIEKQTQALFGRPDIRIAKDGSLDTSNDEAVGISFSGLTMLVLEAVAFGSFLWDAEGYVETKYHFFKS